MPGTPAERVRQGRIIVLPEQRILFVPIPKSGCTSVKWHLAGLAGLPAERFAASRSKEVTRSLAIHDMTLWDERCLWSSLAPDEQESILADDDWLRFTVVRDPASRLWSAWQSKALLAEPLFVHRFGEEAWFPRDLSSVDVVLEQFRSFACLLATAEAPHDAHWGRQQPMLDGFNVNFVGRAERPDLTWERLHQHAPSSAAPADLPWENRSLLPYDPAVYDTASAEALATFYARDFARFGYRPSVNGGDADAWRERAARALPMLTEVRARHERMGDLLDLVRETHRENLRLERRLTRIEDRERARRELRASRREAAAAEERSSEEGSPP